MQLTPWFIATERFTPAEGEKWDKYVAWSGLKQLDEVVSLDGLLCPKLLHDIKDDYWPHIVNRELHAAFLHRFRFPDDASRGP